MKAKKLYRFAAIKEFDNLLEDPEDMKGEWSAFFGNKNPIVLELACGKGEYAVNMAKAFPNKNFIGVDIKGNRMFVGAKKALDEEIKNVGFLRAQIQQLGKYFDKKEFSEIWITFPDPFLKDSKAKNRLTHSRFLKIYQELLPEKAMINLKTDSKPLFDFTVEMVEWHKCDMVQKIDNVYAEGEPDFPLNIKTFYEQMHLEDNRTIQYISFQLPKETIVIPPKKKKKVSKKPLFGDDELFYLNNDGFMVFTAEYLLKRGYCCGNGCKHCPFEYKNVENELRRKKLIQEQQERNEGHN